MYQLLLPTIVDNDQTSASPRRAAGKGGVWPLLVAMFLVALATSVSVAFTGWA